MQQGRGIQPGLQGLQSHQPQAGGELEALPRLIHGAVQGLYQLVSHPQQFIHPQARQQHQLV